MLSQMQNKNSGNRCLTYIPVPHLGYWVVQICVSILEHFPADILAPTLLLPRSFRAIASSVEVREAVPYPFPFRYSSPILESALSFRFKRALANADPRNTIVYFWPLPPLSLVRYARERGFITVREMINTCTQTAKVILDDAYARLGLRPAHTITDDLVRREQTELSLHDYIFAPSPMVEQSLIQTGVDPGKILRSSYGWLPSRFPPSVTENSREGFRALFVGTICVRKGIPQLLAAWKKSGVSGELLLAGEVEASLRPLLAPYLENHGVRLAGFVSDVGSLYNSADVFIFPSLEEGDPLVTYEAAGCGLPVITTLMGRANIINDGVNGLVVNPFDIDALAQAISVVAKSSEFRHRLGRQAAIDAKKFTYDRVGSERARIMSGLLSNRP